MTDERWNAAWDVYEAACELPAVEGRAFVETALPDPIMAQKILAMLKRLESPLEPEESGRVAAAEEGSNNGIHERLSPGDTVGRFIVTGILGRGGMSEVYAAHDPELHRTVALKLLPAARLGGTGDVERFINEARAASSLNHPSIVTVYEVLRGDPLAIVMELVEGTVVRKMHGGSHTAQQVASWGRQIAQALAVAHAGAIVHRDLKPDNLMLRPDGFVKILDFGLAHRLAVDRGTASQQFGGTLRYMSPEQARGGQLNAPTDIFSLGIVLYELATGVHPFQSDSPFESVHLILTQKVASPTTVNPAIPVAFDSLILAMLDKDPEQRPSAKETADRLGGIERAGDSNPPARKASLAKRIAARAIAAGVVLAVGLMAAVLWWRENPSAARAGMAPPVLRAEPLDSVPGHENNPAFSPDGGRIAYAWDGGIPGKDGEVGLRDIYVKPGVGSPLRITTGPGDDCNPTWSPDASRIAFVRYSAAGAQVVTVPALGGAERVVGTIADSRAIERKLIAWSPDADEIVVADNSPGLTNRLRLYGLRISTGARRNLTSPPDDSSDVSPAFSPDGRYLAFLRLQGGATFGLFVIPTGGGAARLLATAVGPIQGIAWTADSRAVLYSWGPSVPDRIWRAPLHDGAPAPAPFVFPGEARELAVSARGKRLAFVQSSVDTNIWTKTPGTDDAFQKLIASTREDEDPRFSQDGGRIAFTSRRSGQYEIWVCQRDGSDPHAITSQGAFAGSSAWSPDGRTIAYDSIVSGETEIWLVSAAGGQPRRLLNRHQESKIPNWSSDGAWVYFSSKADGSDQIWKVRAAGGAPLQVTKHGGNEGFETPDGKFLYFVKSPGVPGLWRMPVAGGEEEIVPELRSFSPFRYWTMAHGGIYYVEPDPRPVLKCFDLQTRRIGSITSLPVPPLRSERGLSVSADGGAVLYTQSDATHREIMVIEGFR